AEIFPLLTGGSKRLETELPFLEALFDKHLVQRVFDSCAGTGLTANALAQRGYSVVANEFDSAFRTRMVSAYPELPVTDFDWRDIPSDMFCWYHAVLNLGNSITYMFTQEDRERALSNFAGLLQKGGVLVLDRRNYERMYRLRDSILKNPLRNFPYKRKVNYCGTEVSGYPVVIEPDLVVMEYLHHATGKRHRLELFPLTDRDVRSCIQNSGLQLESICGDYEDSAAEDSDFFQYIAVKP
ncbi:class I SAM-dependent methyltransferase, partial [Candidatus Woesearchaeota archaeon]|nr:class I SAM-dependent methyltransferase [Candidatus Woesearchaeota archaeon]